MVITLSVAMVFSRLSMHLRRDSDYRLPPPPIPSEISLFLILRWLILTLDNNLRWDSANGLGAL
jgi:hypothetical protein